MFKHLQKMLLIVALCLPWVTQAQSLEEYQVNVGTTTFTSIASTGTEMTFSSTDDGYATVTLPFAMPYGTSTLAANSTITCSANGFICLDTTATSGTTGGYSSTVYRVVNAIMQQDAHIGRYDESGAFWSYDSTSTVRSLTIEYHGLGTYSDPYGFYSYQVVLYENGNIEFIYDSVNTAGATRTLATYLTDGPHNDHLFVTGSWANPTISNAYESRPNTPAPAHGLCYTFVRPAVINCPRPTMVSITDILPDGATISWTHGGTETQWELTCGNNVYYPTDTFYTVSNLTSNTLYSVIVRAICGAGDTSTNRFGSFRTACGTITAADLPFMEGFESYSAVSTATIPCWAKGTNSSTQYPYPSTTVVSGARSLYFYGYYPSSSTGTRIYSWLALPPIDNSLDISDLMLTMKVKRGSTASNYYTTLLYIGIADSVTNFTSAAAIEGAVTWIDTINHFSAAANSIHSDEVAFDSYTGTGKYIVIYCPVPPLQGSSTYAYNYAYVDDITVRTIPTCYWPTAMDATVGPNSANITWTPDSRTMNPNGWIIEYGEHGFTPGDGISTTSSGASITLGGLMANTLYDIYISADCGAGDVSEASMFTFRTQCAWLDELPYVEGFETTPTGTSTSASFVECMTRLNNGSSYYGYPYVSTSASYVHSGTKGTYWYHTTTTGTYGDYQVIVLPGIDTTVYAMSDLTLSFWAATTGTSYHPQPIVGVMTDPNDISTFTPVYTFNSTQITPTWTNFAISLENYTGYGNYLAIRWNRTTSTSYMAIDDIYLTDEWCNPPSNVVATPEEESVTITWNANGGTLFNVIFGEDTITDITDNHYTFYNLTSNTQYSYSVTNVCSSSVSQPATGTVRTLCGDLDSLPYSYGFEGMATGSSTVHPVINCWQHLNNGTQYFGYPYVSASSPHSGNRNLYWYASTTATTYGDYQIVVLPSVDTNVYPIRSLQLKFWARSSSSSYHPYFQVGVMTNPTDASTFQLVSSIDVGNGNTTWTEFTTQLNNYNGNGKYVALRAVRPSSAWYAYTDDFTLEPMPSCPPVVDLAAETVTSGAAMLTWDYIRGTEDEPTSFNIVVVDSANNTSTYNTSETYYQLTGLDANAEYRVYVSTNCNNDNGGMDSVTFSTVGLPCLVVDASSSFNDTLVNGTTTNSYIPSYSTYNYSLTQQIFTSAEIGHGGTITSVKFMPSAFTVPRTLEIYMGHVTVSSATAFTYPSDLTMVYNSGTAISMTAGQWNELQLSTPFNYNGGDNLIIMVRDMTGSWTSGNTWYGADGASNVSRYIYQDASSYPIGTTTGGTASTFRSNIILCGMACAVEATCSNPAVTVVNVDTTEIEIAWIPGYQETSWNLEYRVAGGTWQTEITNTSNTTYTFTNLNPATQYEFRVSHTCDTTTYSATTSAYTQCVPYSVPFTESFENWNGSTIGYTPNPCWVNYSPNTSYFPNVSTSYAHTGSKSMYLDAYTYNSYAYISLPILDVPVDSLSVNFWLYKSSSSYAPAEVQVGVMSDPYDYNTFSPVGTFVPVYGEGWTMYDVNLNTYAGNGKYIAFALPMMGSNAYYPYIYLDDITVDYIPTCPHVTNIHTTMVDADSMTIVWTPGGSEEEWSVSYGDNYVVVNDNQITITGLGPNLPYDFTIRALCDDEDSSMSMNFRAYAACGKLTQLPYTMDFEDAPTGTSSNSTFVNCWTRINNATSYFGYPYVGASTTYNHTDGGTKGLYYYGSTTTGTYGDYMIISLPEVDTATLPVNNLMLTFWAKPSSTSYEPIFYAGVMSNPLYDTTFIYYDTIVIEHSNTDWHKYVVMFDQFSDSGSYIALRANRTASTWYAYVDDITLDVIPDCSPVEDIAVAVGPTSAMATWTTMGNNYQGAYVEYREATTETWSSVTATGVYYAAINGLQPNTTYDIRISAMCDEGNSVAVTSQFTTASFGCSEFDSSSLINVTVGNGATTNTYIPSTSLYNYGYTQQFFKGSEIGGSGVITSISLTPTAITQQRTYEIYMGTSTDTAAASFITPTNMTCVYNGGQIPLVANQPVVFNLTTPFNFDASNGNNLVVIFRDITGTYVSGNTWKGDDAWTNASRYVYNDGSAYTPGSVTGGTASTFRNQITFFGGNCLQASSCAAPPAAVVATTPTTIDVAWAPGNNETAWNLYYRQAGETSLTAAAMGVTSTNYQFTGLIGGTNYELLIVSVCADSMSTLLHAATECAAISTLPYHENFNNWGTGTGHIPNCWYRTGSYSTYTYISGSYNRSGNTGGAIYMYQSGGNHSTIFLPALDTTVLQANQTQLVFHSYKTSDSYLNPGFEVGVLTDPSDINSFVPVQTVYQTVGAGTWEVFEVPLDAYTGNGAYIGIRTADNPNSNTQYTYGYPYLDDFTLELIPTCPRPDSLTATNATTSSVDLGWHERGGANDWIIEYGPMGFTPGTGTTVAANSNPFTLTNLPSAYQGEFYVKSICGNGDTGEYSREPFAFATSQIPATLPYSYNFEDAAEWANWQTSTNSTTNWFRGSAVAANSTNSMYISADQGATYSPYLYNAIVNAAAYRDVDFGPVDSSYTLSFKARVGGTTSASYDGLMVFLVDPSIATVPSNSGITSPWGNVNNLYRIATVRLDTTWQTYRASFDTISGIHRVAFFWFNQSTSSYENWPEPAAVDDIQIDYSECPRPVALEAISVGSSSVTLAWNGPASASYQIFYRTYPTGTNTMVTSNTNSVTITGLQPLTQYVAWVRKVCGSETSLTSDGALFTTEMCDNAVEMTTGAATGTTYYAPVNNFYKYTLTETIIDSAELAGMGDITAVAYNYNYSTASTDKTNVTIYLKHTTKSAFSSGTDMETLDSTALQVYTGHLNCSQGWNYFMFDTTFTWDGHSNIMVIVDDNSNDYNSSSYVFNSTSCTEYKTLVWYSDSYNPDPTSSSFSGTKTYFQYRPTMSLISCSTGCYEPTLLPATNVTYQSATVNWSGSASSYEVSVKAASDPTWPAETVVSGNSFNVSALMPATTYQFRVRAICDAAEGIISDWSTGNFITDSLPCFSPSDVELVAATVNSATIRWTANGNENSWRIRVWNTAFDQTYDVTSNPFTVTGLSQTVTYNATVSALCGGIVESDPSDTIVFTTATCQPATNVTVTNVTALTAVVNWNGTANSYNIEYGPLGFGAGDGTTINGITNTTYTITDLEPEMQYDVYVYANCDGQLSVASGVVHFTTMAGIANVDGSNISIYPNPATSATVVSLTGISGDVTLTIVDMNGRTVRTETMGCEGDCSKRIEIDGLAQGAYFVRISGESINAVKKLVVK